MSFLGKKYRRVGSENVTELVNATHVNEQIIRILQGSAPTVCFTRLDDDTYQMTLQTEDNTFTTNFKLGEEVAMQRRDGTTVKVTYTMEGDSILKQVIKQADGRIAHFWRQFGDKEAIMKITMEGTDVEARIFYEAIE